MHIAPTWYTLKQVENLINNDGCKVLNRRDNLLLYVK